MLSSYRIYPARGHRRSIWTMILSWAICTCPRSKMIVDKSAICRFLWFLLAWFRDLGALLALITPGIFFTENRSSTMRCFVIDDKYAVLQQQPAVVATGSPVRSSRVGHPTFSAVFPATEAEQRELHHHLHGDTTILLPPQAAPGNISIPTSNAFTTTTRQRRWHKRYPQREM
jgi:hypothetical protein